MDFSESYADRCGSVAVFCRLGLADKLKEALDHKAPADVKDNRGWYATHEAAFGDHAECLKLLLENSDVNVNWQSFDGSTALLVACRRGNFESAKILLENGGDPNLGTIDQMRPLIAAAHQSSCDLVNLLLSWGADFTLSYWNGWTALHEACSSNSKQIVAILLEKGADPSVSDEDGLNCAFVCSQYGHLSCLDLILSKAPSLSKSATNDGISCVYIAAQEGYDKCLKLLLDSGADPNICSGEGVHPVAAAVRSNYTRCLGLLLPHTDMWALNKSSADPVYIAVEEGHLDSLEYLLDAGCQIERRTEYNNMNAMYYHLGPLLDRKSLTPLGMAVARMNVEAMRRLLQRGASSVAKQNSCHSPLLFAILKRQRPEVLQELIKFDVDLNARSDNSHYNVPDALLMASHPIYMEQLKLMLKCGLRVRLENWCQCKTNNQLSLIAALRQILTEQEMNDLLSTVLEFTRGYPRCCQLWMDTAPIDDVSPPTLKHLARLAFCAQLSPKQMFENSWPGLEFLPAEVKDFVIYK